MKDGKKKPLVAILCQDTFAAIGLRQMLQTVMPVMDVEAFSSVEQLIDAGEENFAHFFVYVGIMLTDRLFFLERKRKTIVLTTTDEQAVQLSDFHCLRITVPERQLVRSLLALQQQGHPQRRQGHNADMGQFSAKLSAREIDVLRLIVKGFINKEIADKLNISLTTVITHRKNIMDKLEMRSVSSLTIYAVMNGYVSIDEI